MAASSLAPSEAAARLIQRHGRSKRERERERESTPDAMNTIFLKEEEKSDMIKLQKCNTVNTNSRFRFESVQ